MTTRIESKLKVLIAVNEANRIMYDYLDQQQKEIERLTEELKIVERDDVKLQAGVSAKNREIDRLKEENKNLESDIRSYRNGHETNGKRYFEALKEIESLREALKEFNQIWLNTTSSELVSNLTPYHTKIESLLSKQEQK